jgi:2-hydroxychromene-2-carboxylate isomerase
VTVERIVDYYFAPQSPWSYLGHARFAALAAAQGLVVRVKPIDLGSVFAVSGGQPLAQRPKQRQSYRLVELARFAKHLGLPLNLHPAFFPVAGSDAARAILAAVELDGADAGMRLAGALMRAVWAEERDIADPGTLGAIASAAGLDAAAIAATAASPDVQDRYAAFTEEAIAREVFGAPTYVPRFGPAADERFWGQDRLDLLAAAVAR